MTQLRIGIWTRLTTSWADLLDQWRRIEQLGFDAGAVTDHFMPRDGNDDGPMFEAWTSLSALAALVPRIRVVVMVSGNTYRNPAALAKQAITVDHVSGGRLELGMGAGWFEREHSAYGFRFPPPGERVDMLAESARIARALLRSSPGDRLTFNGRFYQLEDAPFAPDALQPGGIPLMIAAQGRRMLRVVAECADNWNLNQSPATLRELTPILERHCAELGRDPAEIRRSIFTYHGLLEDDPFASIDNFRRAVQAYAQGGAQEIYFRMPPPERYNVLEEVSAQLSELRVAGESG